MNYLPISTASYPRGLECWGIYWGSSWRNTPHTNLPAAKEEGSVVKVKSLASPKGHHQAFELPALWQRGEGKWKK